MCSLTIECVLLPYNVFPPLLQAWMMRRYERGCGHRPTTPSGRSSCRVGPWYVLVFSVYAHMYLCFLYMHMCVLVFSVYAYV